MFQRATTPGERQAAAAAMTRTQQALQAQFQAEAPIELKFSLPDVWQRGLFSALCRRHGLQPYRYKGQRRTTLMVRAPRSFIDKRLWPEYRELHAALHSYLNEATERIIRASAMASRTLTGTDIRCLYSLTGVMNI